MASSPPQPQYLYLHRLWEVNPLLILRTKVRKYRLSKQPRVVHRRRMLIYRQAYNIGQRKSPESQSYVGTPRGKEIRLLSLRRSQALTSLAQNLLR